MANPLTLQAIVEMLNRELDASKSITDHLSFLKRVAADEPMSVGLRDHLVTHIGEEEAEHQAHLARLLPALTELATTLSAAPAPGAAPSEKKPKKSGDEKAPAAAAPAPAPVPSSSLTVGDLVGKRPWYVA